MDNDAQMHELIERYLDGLMTEAEANAFEQQLWTNQTLRASLEDEQLVRAAMQRQRELDLRAKLKKWRQEMPKSPYVMGDASKKRPGWWWVGLLVLILLFVGYQYFFLPPQKPVPTPGPAKENIVDSTVQIIDNKQIAENKNPNTHSKDYPKNGNNARSRSAELAQVLIHSEIGYIKPQPTRYRGEGGEDTIPSVIAKREALLALDNGNFDMALRWLQQANQADAEVLQLTAHSLFGSKRYAEAAETFRLLLSNKRFGVDARWNMVMCYFAQYPEGQEDYRRELQQLLESSSPKLRAKALKWQEEVREKMPTQ